MALHKSSRPGPRPKPPGRNIQEKGLFACTMPATITPGPFSTRQKMFDFIASATEGISVLTDDGIEIVIKI